MFQSNTVVQSHSSDDDGWVMQDHSVFGIRPPQGWAEEERYSFDWATLKESEDPFANYQFDR